MFPRKNSFIERRRRPPFRWKGWVLGLALTILVWDMGRFAGALEERSRAQFLSAPSVDLIAVLTGGQGRLREAIDLFEGGKGRYLLISGTSSSLEDILAANGGESLREVQRQNIYLDSDSQTTSENAEEVRRSIEGFQARTVLLVTSNYHMERSLRLIEEELAREPALNVELYSYPVQSPNFNPESWWSSVDAWRIFLSEYVKSWWAQIEV